eukprot:1560369-Prymnesium_polylepis.1
MVGRAVQLVAEDESGRLALCASGVDALRRLDAPVTALCVAGTARCGKSFLANQLLGQMDGFRVNAGVRRCTHGIWLWSEPAALDGGDASRHNHTVDAAAPADNHASAVVVLDIEALDGDDSAGGRLFCLAAALASS